MCCTYVPHVHSICAARAQHMCRTCTAYALHVHSICAARAQHMCRTCTAYVLHVHSICAVHPPIPTDPHLAVGIHRRGPNPGSPTVVAAKLIFHISPAQVDEERETAGVPPRLLQFRQRGEHLPNKERRCGSGRSLRTPSPSHRCPLAAPHALHDRHGKWCHRKWCHHYECHRKWCHHTQCHRK